MMVVHDKKKIIILMISILILFTIIGVITVAVSKFRIIKVYEDKSHLYVKTTKYKKTTYNLSVMNDKNKVIYEKTSKSNKIDITDLNLKYNQKVKIKVVANTKKDKRESNIYEYTNKDASFNTKNNTFDSKDENIVLNIDGYNKKEKYYIELYYEEEKILTIDDVKKENNINYSDLNKYEGRITAKLYNKNKRLISSFNFYINVKNVGEFKLLSPEDNEEIYWGDVDLYYTGGENADTLTIKFYDVNNNYRVIDSINMKFTKDHAVIPSRYFDENTSYILEITASYKGYDEIGQTETKVVNILDKGTVKPVYINKNNNYIKKDTEIELLCDTKDATIYYTLDGTTPDEGSFLYKEPIKISTNSTITAYAVKKDMYDSVVNTYKFNIQDKDLVLYLSPSNQDENPGAENSGYTNEMVEMNKLADDIGINLKNKGITIYRNNPNATDGINSWVADSNAKNVDFHFAIHSNASETHDKQGIEIYVDNPDSACLSIASNIYKNLYEIYPYKSSFTNRGVKYARGTLGEVNEDFLKCGVLIEVAFHDNYNDATWIVNNRDEIATNIANTIIDFYQVSN